MLKNQNGSQTIEFVAAFPMLILGMALIWQFTLAGYWAIVIEGSVRDAARAAASSSNFSSATTNADRAADRAAGKNVNTQVTTFNTTDKIVTVRVSTTIPVIFPGVTEEIPITRSVTMMLEK